ncbi:MAG: 50S ribosomal protein L22 [Candidatus Nitrosocaldaceae archaeon]
MPHFSYSFQNYDKTKHVRASLREVDISHKHAREICKAINGMKLSRAREYLENVIAKKEPVPFRRYKLEVGHRSELQGFPAGRYPVKAASEFIKLFDNLESNAEYKGMDIDRLKIIHVAAYPGIKIRNFIERAFGRGSPRFNILTHVEIVAMEV